MATNAHSPFKFLDSYDKEDKEIFFGREMETYELYDRVFETKLVLLYGASGTGKTSLINCGLGNQFESSDWHPIFIRRSGPMLEALNRELRKQAVKDLVPGAKISEWVHSIYLDYFKPIYLIFDQFEEIFILGEEEEQQIFFEELSKLLASNTHCKVIISMREEYIAHLSDYEYIIPSLFDNRLRVEQMSTKNLREVIIGTAEAFDIEIKNSVETADLIIQNLRDKRHGIDLANLQVYLDRLYQLDLERRGEDKRPIRFDKELVEKTGELEDVLSHFLDEQLRKVEAELEEQLNVRQKGIPLDVLFALVTDNGTKKVLEIESLKQGLKNRKQIQGDTVDYCIRRFKEMRILRELSDE